MRKILIFALILAIALGGLGFAHVSVTDSQDELVIYPIAEQGDGSVLSGSTAVLLFSCGEHLLWHTEHTFGGETKTDFVYDRKGSPQTLLHPQNAMELWITSGTSASTTDSFQMHNHSYGSLFQAVAAQTPNGGSHTMRLKMADFVDYYAPDFSLYYQENNRQCNYQMNLVDYLNNMEWQFRDEGIYNSFLDLFRFPVQEDHYVNVTVIKDDLGRMVSIDFYADSGPELRVVSDLSAEGIWFIPVFRDETGAPLPYESPEGYGIYFIPWKVLYTYDTQVDVAPDLGQIRQVIALDEDLLLDHMEIDSAAGECRILSREGGSYVLTCWDLTTGTVKTRSQVLPYDAEQPSYGEFVKDEGFLLVTAQDRLALVDPEQGTVLLTAPDTRDQYYRAASHDPASGTLRFDAGRLYLLNPVYSFYDGAFWTAVWQEGELLYYGEYDCSLMRGNDDYYYREITTEGEPMVLLIP